MPADPATEALIVDVLRRAGHPAITAVTPAADATAWCRIRVECRDGSGLFIGIGG